MSSPENHDLSDVVGPSDPVEYDRWLQAKVQAALDDPRPSIPHEEVMAHLRARILRSRQKAEPPSE